jgi:hypothetical protein
MSNGKMQRFDSKQMGVRGLRARLKADIQEKKMQNFRVRGGVGSRLAVGQHPPLETCRPSLTGRKRANAGTPACRPELTEKPKLPQL